MLYAGPKLENPAGTDAFEAGGGGGGSSDPLVLADNAVAPSAPASGIKLYAIDKADRRRPGWVGPSGIDTSIQEFIGANKIGFWSAGGNSTTGFNNATPGIMLWNFGHTTQGTVTARNVAASAGAGRIFNSTRRLGFAQGAATSAGTRHGLSQFALLNGFEYIARFGISGLPSSGSAGYWAGLQTGTNALTSTFMLNGAAGGVGAYLSTAGGFQIVHAVSSGSGYTVHKTLNATTFPSSTASIDLYELRLFCPPGATTMAWRVERLNTGDYDEGLITADLPASTALLMPQIACAGSAVSLGVAIDVVSQYIVTDF
ncbi:MAG: hypothetical protein JHC81_04950 [Brevundimonas sp.]|uniref:hypothetical protein n=1 Tax=Brevundimonas sp. TaxID=1871086 RepID=UPI001A1BBDE6|nr:hypothetical protein [Brevundimonas sp.]MBJ7446863.1 hypothetical protein [Brevundimonas sp.]